MTTAQPGQEQRMVTDAMIEAGTAVLRSSGRLQHEAEGADEELVAAIVFAAINTRPTPDLGEDGELVELLRNFSSDTPYEERMTAEAADRIELYREALVDAFGTLHYIYETTDDEHEKRAAAEARDKIGAVLRSGG